MSQFAADLTLYAVVAVDALMYDGCGIDWQVVFMADAAYRLDVVCMVVGNQYVMHLRQTESEVTEILLQRTQTHSNVNQQTVIFGKQEVAIATASAAK